MSRGLLKLSSAANTIEAKRDFARLADEAINAGRVDLVKRFMYPEGASWRKIDKHLAKLREALNPISEPTGE